MPSEQKRMSALRHATEILVKEIGLPSAANIAGKSTASLNRYYNSETGKSDTYMPIDVVAKLEAKSSFPYVTKCLADFHHITFQFNPEMAGKNGAVSSDVIKLSERFAMLMMKYNEAMLDNKISVNEAKSLIREASEIQKVLLEIKLHVGAEVDD